MVILAGDACVPGDYYSNDGGHSREELKLFIRLTRSPLRSVKTCLVGHEHSESLLYECPVLSRTTLSYTEHKLHGPTASGRFHRGHRTLALIHAIIRVLIPGV